jgi:hypothetical protein
MLPQNVQGFLATASTRAKQGARVFRCMVFGSPWDQFVEEWAPKVCTYVEEVLGPYGTEPLPTIQRLADGAHMSGATASFNMSTGQVSLCTSVEGNPGQTLEKLTHEFIHGSLSEFPSVDPFYDEGAVDYSTWVMAHGPVYGWLRDATVAAAEFNISMRRERAMKNLSDYDRKRWAGGTFYHFALGPMILHRLRMKKAEGDFTW